MPKWYKLIKDEKHIEDFLNYIQGLHDYRIEKATYEPRRNILDLFLKYDTGKEGILLRFFKLGDFHIESLRRDYLCDYIYDCSVVILNNGLLFWGDDEIFAKYGIDNELERIKRYCSYVESDELFWAVTDGDGNPVNEEQAERYNEKSNDCRRQFNLVEELDLNPYEGDFSELESVWLYN